MTDMTDLVLLVYKLVAGIGFVCILFIVSCICYEIGKEVMAGD